MRDELAGSCKGQVAGLVDGGEDFPMTETIFDTLDSMTSVFAVNEYFVEANKERPPVSATIVDNSGRTLCKENIS